MHSKYFLVTSGVLRSQEHSQNTNSRISNAIITAQLLEWTFIFKAYHIYTLRNACVFSLYFLPIFPQAYSLELIQSNYQF